MCFGVLQEDLLMNFPSARYLVRPFFNALNVIWVLFCYICILKYEMVSCLVLDGWRLACATEGYWVNLLEFWTLHLMVKNGEIRALMMKLLLDVLEWFMILFVMLMNDTMSFHLSLNESLWIWWFGGYYGCLLWMALVITYWMMFWGIKLIHSLGIHVVIKCPSFWRQQIFHWTFDWSPCSSPMELTIGEGSSLEFELCFGI